MSSTTTSYTGPLPTLIEWDNDVPAFPVLAAEAERAMRVMTAETKRRERRGAGMVLAEESRYADPLGFAG